MKFALNIGVQFKTPEQMFIDKIEKSRFTPVSFSKNETKQPFTLTGFNPFKHCFESTSYKFNPKNKELILMIGAPGSGKTDFVKQYIIKHDYDYVNQDSVKSKAKCMQIFLKAIEKQKSIVIDNTNYLKKNRMEYVEIALKHSYTVRYLIMNTNLSLAKHLNYVRHIYSGGKLPLVNNIVYAVYKKNYNAPLIDECSNIE
ncbi:hypothetical protein EON71_01235, partial [bacterium]